MKYYYITWHSLYSETKGSACYSYEDDIDLYHAHTMISINLNNKNPIYLSSWKEITKYQYMQYSKYVDEVLNIKNKTKILTLVKK